MHSMTTPDLLNSINKLVYVIFHPFQIILPKHFEFELSTCADLSNNPINFILKSHNIYRWDHVFWKNVKSFYEGILDFDNVASQSQMNEGIQTITYLLNN